jgi:hypothetical protein
MTGFSHYYYCGNVYEQDTQAKERARNPTKFILPRHKVLNKAPDRNACLPPIISPLALVCPGYRHRYHLPAFCEEWIPGAPSWQPSADIVQGRHGAAASVSSISVVLVDVSPIYELYMVCRAREAVMSPYTVVDAQHEGLVVGVTSDVRSLILSLFTAANVTKSRSILRVRILFCNPRILTSLSSLCLGLSLGEKSELSFPKIRRVRHNERRHTRRDGVE